jgi:hypothetical protein
VFEQLTTEQRERFIALIRVGISKSAACDEVGVFSVDTLTAWEKKAKDGDERYVDFIRDVKQAHARSKIELQTTVKKAGAADWRAAAWLLERLHPKEFAQLQKQEHSGPEGAPLAVGGPVMILPAKEVEEFVAPPPPPPPPPPAEDA